ncbi:hypothetical protein L107_02724 [Cyanobium sp. Copco_Reservoir_LC18]|uniref:hypothetical protein n=1 Tax=Cyanobium sp. Copco_Reservoir_LC18 TaxID=1328305 RepID=UPI00135BF867|nr:hypothetical protein [Cyanobium sp. Copco_Reservoir_LC18]KAF0654585.1 hypothetical protein L107_02724 [Cyanobium sp. Copco_Reservoir_LC18]
MEPTATGSNRSLLKVVVALTPVAGSILFPLVVPILMLRVSISAGVIAAVLIGTLWFAAMLRTSEMPGHH